MSLAYSFLPWLRQGAATAIAALDDPNTIDLPTNEAVLPIQLRVETQELPHHDQVEVALPLYGPADVIGIDQQQVIRTEPPHRTNNFLPNYFAAIEFDHPGLPWLFTPAQAEPAQGRLRPWIVLVVVRKQTGVTLRGNEGGPLPVLEIRAPALAQDELPDLSESWAWAHTQVVHSTGQLEATLHNQPEQTVSRLLCPRQLAAHAAYYACLVPAFEVGRQVGLGQSLSEPDTPTLKPAWNLAGNPPPSLQLPVYYHWEFSTGQAGDFEHLAQQLQPRDLPPEAGFRRLHVGQAGVDHWPDFGTVDFAGVFRPLQFEGTLVPAADAMPQTPQGDWQRELTQTLNGAAAAAGSDPVVGPPLYGQFQQSQPRLPNSASWMRDLNLDPRHRAAAGLGALFVQAHQDDLMHAAWQQLGDIQQAQQLQRQNQLAQAVGAASYGKHFRPLLGQSGQLLYQMTAPAHARIPLPASTQPQTLVGWAQTHQLPQPTTLAVFRQVARPGGPIQRRLRGQDGGTPPLSLQPAQIGPREPQALATTQRPLATVMADLALRVSHWRGVNPAVADRLDAAVKQVQWPPGATPAPQWAPQASPPAQQAKAALATAFDSELQHHLLAALDPTATVPRLLHSRLRHAGQSSAAPLTHPSFPQPMYSGIREFMPELLLPGVDHIEDNTITLLETHPQFIEAFMVGVNHEMARELLWRGFATDQRGTYFRSFWSYRSPDLQPLHTWSLGERLGTHLSDGHSPGQLVMVIRGELLRRFPDAIIYAVAAESDTALGTVETYPLHRGQLTDDAIFLLFDLSEDQVLGRDGSPGWFFVIQQQPTELRFGLDVPLWHQVATSNGGYLSIAATPPERFTTSSARWGFNSAHMADITLQRPFRVAIHGRHWLQG